MSKKMKLLCLVLTALLLLGGCGKETPPAAETAAPTDAPAPTAQAEATEMPAGNASAEEAPETAALPSYDQVDYDLSLYSEVMVYAALYDMTVSPARYQDAVVRLSGVIERKVDGQGQPVFYCVAYDETNCCSVKVQLDLRADSKAPKTGFDTTVTGVMSIYQENGQSQCRLSGALVQ